MNNMNNIDISNSGNPTLQQTTITLRLLLYAIFIATLIYIQYFTERFQSTHLLLSYVALFLIYIYFLKTGISNQKEIITITILTRVVLLLSFPNLSDDFYRFIWDGRLLATGNNPFTNTPEYYMSTDVKINGLTSELYQLLNSKNYFTIYPPISQFIFWLSVKLNTANDIFTSVFIMHFIILLFEIGNLFLLKKLLSIQKIPQQNIIIYALNPLVIIELVGNLHFEGVMIFFLLLSIYLFYNKTIHTSAIAIAASIATKLIPLMLLPVFIRRHKGFIAYYMIIGISLILFFVPMLDTNFIYGFSESLSLFFKSFEFNGGLFFLLREIGFYIKGYDIVQSLGPLMSITALIIILGISFFMVNKNSKLEYIFIIIFFVQLLFATTVHPWYIIPMVALSCMTKFKFPVIWSFFIFLTYAGYSSSGFEHPFFIIALEYITIIPLAIYEIYQYQIKNSYNLNYH